MSYREIILSGPPIRRGGGGAFACMLLLLAAYFLLYRHQERLDTHFEAAKWKASNIDADDTRVCMAPDLARRIVAQGWDVPEVRAELGEPATTEQREMPAGGRQRLCTVMVYPLRRISDAVSPDGAYALYVEPRFGTTPPHAWTACLRDGHVRVWERPTTAAIMLGLDDECASTD